MQKLSDHMEVFKTLGINTENKTYEQCVEILLHLYIDAMKQIETDNKEFFKQGVKNLLKPNN